MCGIFGMGFQNGCTMLSSSVLRYMLQNLFEETQIRGADATGIAFANGREIAVLKAPMEASKFMVTEEFNNACQTYLSEDNSTNAVSIIAHCREKTKGTEGDNNNNHPIICRNVVGVHNGVLENNEILYKEFPNLSRKGLVDSEIIFSLIDYFVTQEKLNTLDAVVKMSRLVKGSYVCAMLDSANPFLLWLFRNKGPLTILHYAECGLVVFASSGVFITNALTDVGLDNVLGESERIYVSEDSGLCINLFSNEIKRFKLEEPKTLYVCNDEYCL